MYNSTAPCDECQAEPHVWIIFVPEYALLCASCFAEWQRRRDCAERALQHLIVRE